MNNVATKLKGIVFIIAGVLWTASIFINFFPTVSLSSNDTVVFILATICGFSVMTYGMSVVA